MVASTAYLLVSHGSRDPRPQVAMDHLSSLVSDRLINSIFSIDRSTLQARSRAIASSENVLLYAGEEKATRRNTVLLERSSSGVLPELQVGKCRDVRSLEKRVIVDTACLEFAPVELSEHIRQLGERLVAMGVRELKILPVFLMAGMHVKQDLPEAIAAAKASLDGAIELTVCSHLGSHPQMGLLLSQRLEQVNTQQALLVAHGSRRPKGNRKIALLGRQMEMKVAYWAVPPDIESQVIDLIQGGCQQITILPYFLFPGGITDAIAHRTEELAERFPKTSIRLLPPLGATDEIADIACDLLLSSEG